MKKKWIVLISAIILFLVAVCFLTALFRNKKINNNSVSNNSVAYCKEKVTLEDIKPNETVLVMTVVSYTSTCREKYVMIVNKNRQVKYVDLSNEKELKELLLNDYDAILQDKKIAFKKEKFEISNEMLRKIININNYKLEEKRRQGAMSLS